MTFKIGKEPNAKGKAFLNMDVEKLLRQLEAKYNLKLPRPERITIDYDEDAGDLYVRFKNAEATEGEPTSDGKTIIHYDNLGKIAAIETTITI